MALSKNHYSSSLLDAFLRESDPASRDKETLPQIQVEDSEYAKTDLDISSRAHLKDDTLRSSFSEMSFDPKNSRISTISSASTLGTLRSTVSALSDDLDLQSLKLTLEKFDSAKLQGSKFKRLKLRILREDKHAELSTEDEQFLAYVLGKLKAQHYLYEKNSTLNVMWENAAEVFFFGDAIDNIFTDEKQLLNYLVEGSYELGEVRFSNHSKYHTDKLYNVADLLKHLLPRLEKFNGVLDLYAESGLNIERPELFETFSAQATDCDGLCIPLAISMFGNWLLTYNRDKALASNYENTLILDYFRKSARLSLVLRKVRSLLEENADTLDKTTRQGLNRYWGKDNQNALSTSLYGLGEYYQFVHDYDVAVTLWELNCHLTGDVDLGHLAILGLTDGYGLGNRSKEHNAFGKKSRNHKFNVKRRIAHLYRILMKCPDFDEYGVSWATKDKYD